MKILAFAGSTSSKSINKQLVEYTASFFQNDEVQILDLNDFEVPIYSADREKIDGIPERITILSNLIYAADLLLISMAEHNGAYTAAFKNTLDWLSRVPDRKAFGTKDIFLMATSPGGRGGQGVLEISANRFPRNGGNVIGTFSLPRFYENFEKGEIVNSEYKANLISALRAANLNS